MHWRTSPLLFLFAGIHLIACRSLFPGQLQSLATKKKQRSSDDATGKPQGTASNSVLYSVLSASRSSFQNDHQCSTQCMEEHRHTSMRRSSRDQSCTGPFTMLALKQRSHVNRSFHDACCVCWERFCTKIALEFWLGSFNQISRLFHHNRAKTFAHWSNSLHTIRANCEASKGSRRSLSLPLSPFSLSLCLSRVAMFLYQYRTTSLRQNLSITRMLRFRTELVSRQVIRRASTRVIFQQKFSSILTSNCAQIVRGMHFSNLSDYVSATKCSGYLWTRQRKGWASSSCLH